MNVFFNIREDFMCMLLFITVQDVETKGSPVNLRPFLIEDFLIETLI